MKKHDKFVELFSPEINEVWIKKGSDEVFLVEPIDLPDRSEEQPRFSLRC